MAFRKSIEEIIEEEELEEPNEENTENEDIEKDQPDHPMEPGENIDSYTIPKTKKRPAWLEATLQDAERIKVPEGTSRKSKRPKRFSSYAAYMTKILDEEPTTFEEEVQKGQWKEAMTEEHQWPKVGNGPGSAIRDKHSLGRIHSLQVTLCLVSEEWPKVRNGLGSEIRNNHPSLFEKNKADNPSLMFYSKGRYSFRSHRCE